MFTTNLRKSLPIFYLFLSFNVSAGPSGGCSDGIQQQKRVKYWGTAISDAGKSLINYCENCEATRQTAATKKELEFEDDKLILKSFFDETIQSLEKNNQTTKMNNSAAFWTNNLISFFQKIPIALQDKYEEDYLKDPTGCADFDPDKNRERVHEAQKQLASVVFNTAKLSAADRQVIKCAYIHNRRENAEKHRLICIEQTNVVHERWKEKSNTGALKTLKGEWQLLTMTKGVTFLGVGPTIGPHTWPVACKIERNVKGEILPTEKCLIMDTWAKSFKDFDDPSDLGYNWCRFQKLCSSSKNGLNCGNEQNLLDINL